MGWNIHGWTPRHFAANAGTPDVVACLLAHGTDPLRGTVGP
ncbi:ankyrin repeat domain-containing protein [Nocardia spumae]|nr:ankyrin repeat domain-containing protein [Nocardia spumae]